MPVHADVAQLARASACHAEGRGFESHHPLSVTRWKRRVFLCPWIWRRDLVKRSDNGRRCALPATMGESGTRRSGDYQAAMASRSSTAGGSSSLSRRNNGRVTRFRGTAACVLAVSLASALGVTPARAGGERTVFLHSPSGNIVCEIWAQEVSPDPTGLDNGVACVVRHRIRRPDRPFAYTLHANGAVRGKRLRVRPGVIGHVLSYGVSARLNLIRCRSTVRGMRCVSLRSHHGFSLSRRRAFAW